MSKNGESPLDPIKSCHDIPDHHDEVELTFAPELRSGQVLDERFVIGGPINRSGMATIYTAQDIQNDHQVVAVKVPHLRYEADPNFFSRFQREEEIGRKLNHPFILKFIPIESKSRPYLVTEYLRGCTLAHVMRSLRPLPEKDALAIAGLLCDAIHHMHELGIVHRDLKPENIMICQDRTLRLMDFGIASSISSRQITVVGLSSMMGTPEYMAPEQVEAKRSDERTDVYSLGVILYEMLTGTIPFQNENPWVAMNDRVTGDPVAPRKLNPKLSPQVEEIVLHAMQRNPDARYPSALAMKAELTAPDAIQISGYCHRLQSPRWRLSLRGTPIIAGALLGLGFIVVQVLLFFFLRHHSAMK